MNKLNKNSDLLIVHQQLRTFFVDGGVDQNWGSLECLKSFLFHGEIKVGRAGEFWIEVGIRSLMTFIDSFAAEICN